MGETATWDSDNMVATGLHMNRLESGHANALNQGGGEKSSNRRITADSFRMLSARLKKPAFPPLPIPAVEPVAYSAPLEAFAPPEPVPLPVPDEVSLSDGAFEVFSSAVGQAAHPYFPDMPPEVHEPEIRVSAPPIVLVEAEPEPLPEIAAETVAALAPLPEPVPEPAEEVISEVEVVSPVAVAPEPPVEATPVVTAEVVEPLHQPETVANLDIEPQPQSRPDIAGIGDIAKSIYMTPTSADRAAFLAEVAEMLAAEAALVQSRSEVPVILYSDPVPVAKSQIRRLKPADDPFEKIVLDKDIEGNPLVEANEDAGELARSLLDMMLSGPGSGLPQERALAADALLKLIPRIPLRALVAIVDRVSIMEAPPHLLISKLINDPRIEVAGPLLENCNHISDQVLSKVIASGQVSLQRLIARRRHISAVLSDQLVEFNDTSVLLTLVRNNGAHFSHQAFHRLADHACEHQPVLAPLATRSDLPAPIAFELFWFVPAELRRYLLSRFLTDSETLTKILKITHTMQSGEPGTEAKFPDREDIESFVSLLEAGKLPEATKLLSEIAGIAPESALRIISDRDGEPLAIALKAIGTNRARFCEIIDQLKASDFGIIKGDRNTAELQSVFESMSFNKARVLLTYWDWAVLKSGPYAPAN